MRVTQTMLSNNMLRHLMDSQVRMDKYMEQTYTGKKIRRPSEDPVIAMNGINFRTQLKEVQQYRRNAAEGWNWMNNSDESLANATKAMQRMEDLARSAANGVNSEEELMSIKEEVVQLKEQMRELANTYVNGKYIFNGTRTDTPPVGENWEIDYTRLKNVEIEVAKGIRLQVNVSPENIFNVDLFDTIDEFIIALENGDQEALNDSIGAINESTMKIINERAALGGRMNRLELIENRLKDQEIIAEDTMKTNEGIDFEEAITQLITQEVLHRATLAAGARIVQPTLIDFLR